MLFRSDDVLVGGAGIDRLEGGSGNDIYRVVGRDDLYRDVISDSSGDQDAIEFVGVGNLRVGRFQVNNGIEEIDANEQKIIGDAFEDLDSTYVAVKEQ